MARARSRKGIVPPKLCLLLLKTLLLLLCIYIKRVSGAALQATILTGDVNPLQPTESTTTTTTTTLRPEESNAIEDQPLDTLWLDTQYSLDQDYAKIKCPIDKMIVPKPNPPSGWQKHFQAIKKHVHLSMYKDNALFHRFNGNHYENNLNTSNPHLLLLAPKPSDSGLYTCVADYSHVPTQFFNEFVFHGAASFDMRIDDKNHNLPDTGPSITHPPSDKWVHRGDNVTFTCQHVRTLSTSSVAWFKSCPSTVPCEKEFMKSFETVKTSKNWNHMSVYLIPNANSDWFAITNVSDEHVGHYGCVVSNQQGIDIRLGQLRLLESPNRTPVENRHDFAPPSSTATDNFLNDDAPGAKNNTPNFDHKPRAKPSHSELSDTNMYVILFAISVLGIVVLFFGGSLHGWRPQAIYGKQASLCSNSGATRNGDCQNKGANIRQHLPNGNCPDIYNVGKTADGFISGHLHHETGHLMAQSICSQILSNKDRNPSISSNSPSDEASSWGKSSGSDNCRTLYLHTSNSTATPVYDHPPSTGTFPLGFTSAPMIVQNACVINPTYGFVRPETDANQWAFPRRNLEKLDKIGEGQFGEVWRYIMRSKDGKESFVAVKQLRNRAGLGYRERLELLAEIDIMKDLNNHPNVIKLLNYCVDECEPILLIMEYAENGKLQTYLRNCRSKKAHNSPSNDSASITRDLEEPSITSKELIKFSYHIAKGMEYVASQGIIHRDLASRNILVSREKVCKVADFGFARRISDDCAYERTTANPVPVKWMAPEALVENKFTCKSDVFSLGILMWEIVTLGATPYEYMTSSEVYKKVITGGRLQRPVHCKDEFYNLMARCWLHDPAQRPSFKELADELEKLLLSENDYIELDQYPEHAYYNILNIPEKDVVGVTS